MKNRLFCNNCQMPCMLPCEVQFVGATGPTGPIGPTGPTGVSGATGPTGVAEEILVRDTVTAPQGEKARVVDTLIDTKHVLDFYIPKGVDGADGTSGPTGPIGPEGQKGDTGPQGPAGTSVTILGSYDTYEELEAEHPVGNPGDGYLVGSDLYVWSENAAVWENVGQIRGPQGVAGPTGPTGPQGNMGPTGPAGDAIMRSAYLVTFNSGMQDTGVAVIPGDRLPITREELDISDIVTLNSNDTTIQFNLVGYYKITIVVSAYANSDEEKFEQQKDFVSLGFRLVDTDDIFIGASQWTNTNSPVQITAQGIIAVTNTVNPYEIVNLGQETIYLNTPNLKYISSQSYFTNSLLTITIEYLGRQGA